MNNGYTLFNDTYVMYWLLEFIDESGIIALCKATKKLNEICEQYIEMEDDKRFEISINNNKWQNSILLEKYCENNDVIKIKKLIKINLYWNYGLYGACRGGHMDIVKLLIEKGAGNWNCGLSGACSGGNIDIVNFMIEKGASSWNWGLRTACETYHLDIVKLMIKKGADKCWYCRKSMKEHLSKK